MGDEFWEQSEVVEQFAAREPDHRLGRLADEYDRPGATRVLDLGCAGGRNTVFLAGRGFDVWATDASTAMVERTRERVTAALGPDAARQRIRVERMDDLSAFPDASFDLVVALGVYHNARSLAEWEVALAETVRVLRSGGRLLVNHFTPEVDLTGDGVWPVPGERRVYEGLPGGRTVLLGETALDAAVARHGLIPEIPSQTVTVATERGRRVSVNALYVKREVRR
jgi:SAM-dependent methyltransferase